MRQPLPISFPLTFTFKLLSLASQFAVVDAHGRTVAHVRQKLLRLKEAITVFADETQSDVRYTIAADRVIDFSALYRFFDPQGTLLGSVKRRGMRSLWRVQLDVMDEAGAVAFHIREESVLVRVLDQLFSQVPFVGMLSGYLFHPAYLVLRARDDQPVARLKKQAAFFEGRYVLEQLGAVSQREQEQITLSLMMTTLLERGAG